MRGVADRFLAEGQTVQIATFGTSVMDMSDFPSRHPYTLALFQNKIERIMAGWIAELPVRIHYGCEVTGFAQDDDGVDVHVSGAEPLRSRYLVGCDGGRSLVRKAAGIDFPGWEPTRSNLIAEVEVTEEPPKGVLHDAVGVHGLHRLEDGTVRIVTTEQQINTGAEPTLRELSESLTAAYGTDFGVHDPTWISRFTDSTRQAASYRAGRVLLAGDAVHVHAPTGGQGIGLGVQDAVNLGWKLAQVVHGPRRRASWTPTRPSATPSRRALQYTMAQTMLQRHDERTKALVGVVSELATTEDGRKQLHGAHLRAGHPVRPRRGPRAARAPHARPGSHQRPRLRAPARRQAAAARPRRGRRPRHRSVGRPGPARRREPRRRLGVPVIGAVDAPGAVLVRPDGHVAWVGNGTDAGLTEALTTWFGPAG